MIQVFIIDDHPMVVAGIQALLSESGVAQICGSAHTGQFGLDALHLSQPDVVLVDINLPDINGIDLCIRLRALYPELRIIGLSTFNERSYILRLMEAGASGYLLKNATRDEIEDALKAAMRGQIYMSLEAATILRSVAPKQSASPILTAREKEILQLIAQGMTNLEIASQLFISPLTVDSHRKNLLAKFGVKNTAAMIRLALAFKIIVYD